MNPNPDQIQAIRSFVGALPGGWTNPDAAIRAAMASASVPNPVAAAPTVPAAFGAADLVGACSAPNRAALAPLLAGSAAALILAQDAAHLSEGLDALAAIGSISAADAAGMKSVMSRTQPDPSWSATVAWDVGTLGRPCDDFDLERARAS